MRSRPMLHLDAGWPDVQRAMKRELRRGPGGLPMWVGVAIAASIPIAAILGAAAGHLLGLR